VYDEARPDRSRQHRGAEDGTHGPWVMQRDVEGVIGHGVVAFNPHIRGDCFREAKKNEGVVDQVWSEVEENSGTWDGTFAPGIGLELRAEAIVVGFEAYNATDFTGSDDLQQSLEIAVVTAVLIHRQETPGLLGEIYETGGLVIGRGKRLINDHVATCRQALARQGIMSVIGGSDYHQPDVFRCEQIFDCADYAGFRVGASRFVAVPLDNGGQSQAGDGADNGRMEGTASEPEADKTDMYHRMVNAKL
jgi:hypothetical protein